MVAGLTVTVGVDTELKHHPLTTHQIIVLRRLADDLVYIFSQEIPCLH
jgi:hypothetical protein